MQWLLEGSLNTIGELRVGGGEWGNVQLCPSHFQECVWET